MVKRTFVYVVDGKLATIAIPAMGEKVQPLPAPIARDVQRAAPRP